MCVYIIFFTRYLSFWTKTRICLALVYSYYFIISATCSVMLSFKQPDFLSSFFLDLYS